MVTAKEEVVIAKEEVVIAKEEVVTAKEEVVIAKEEVVTAKEEVVTAKEEVDSAAHSSILLSYLAMLLTSAALSICLCVPLGQTFLSQGGFLHARNKTFLCTAHSDECHASLQICCWVGQSRGIPYRPLIRTLQSPLHIKTGFSLHGRQLCCAWRFIIKLIKLA